ncbi:MAG TPA: radical SAM protein [Candidatus Avacidaminococcus intestinavium]|uniref:Radical SAM protein n=1 Tax=Candidatus Avacidaminococcus intestinavium TaxID=2840684 RepID=A0A9D1SL37_9FIRM|nr:radical SAM protein [Candidatus Avacidaminococcus intestinavium]
MIPEIKMLALSLTGKCNFACKYCYASEHLKQDMSVDTALKALQLITGKEKFILQFTGGEPLLNFECLKAIVLYVTANKLPAIMQLQTNGSLLTDEIAQFLFKYKVAIGLSLDGKPQMNDKLRKTKNGQGATTEIMQGFEVLRRNNIAVGITCVVTSENVNSLEDIVEFAYFLGNVRLIGFDLLRKQGRGTDLMPPTQKEMAGAMQRVYDKVLVMEKLTGLKIKIAQVERAENLRHHRNHCFAHCYAMNGEAAFVAPNGDIYACSSLVGFPEFYLGNVERGLDSILCNDIGERIKQDMNFCRQCEVFAECGGGCFSRWFGSDCQTSYASECIMKKAAIKWQQENN